MLVCTKCKSSKLVYVDEEEIEITCEHCGADYDLAPYLWNDYMVRILQESEEEDEAC